MDKRFFLALLLSAALIIAKETFFPTPRKTPAASVAADSARRADSLATLTGATVATAGATRPVGAVAGDTTASGVPAEAPVTVTTIETGRATYAFSSLGAALVSAEMHDYNVLLSGGKTTATHVQLARPRQQLIRFRVLSGRDTVRLDRVPFTLTRTPASAPGGREALTYDAQLPNGGRAIVDYTFGDGDKGAYVLHVKGRVEGLPAGRAFLLADLPDGLRSQEADTLEDQSHLAYAYKPVREGASSVAFSKLDPNESRLVPGPHAWVVSKSKYFLVGLLAPEGSPFSEVTVTGGPRTSKAATHATATVVQQLRDGGFAFDVYAGPQQWRRLVAMGRDFETSNPYGGWLQGVVQPFATLVMRALLWMHETFKLNYGWVLVIFGVVIRLALWPLNQGAMRTSLKMQAIQPELQAVQDRYKNDPQKLQGEMMKVYKEHGMSPFSSISGCLPMLLPMPILFALFFVFRNTIEFRGVPFLWLADISLKDPFYIIPLVMGISMFVLSWIGMRNAPPNPQAKMTMYMFPAMMTFFFLNVASGLNLYYAVQNLAALPQQWLIANERAKAAAKKGSAPVKGTPVATTTASTAKPRRA